MKPGLSELAALQHGVGRGRAGGDAAQDVIVIGEDSANDGQGMGAHDARPGSSRGGGTGATSSVCTGATTSTRAEQVETMAA